MHPTIPRHTINLTGSLITLVLLAFTTPALASDDVIVDFGAVIGLWARMNDTSWLKLANESPTQVVISDINDTGKDDVIAVFASGGIFINYDLDDWIQLHNSIPDSMTVGDLDNNGQDDVVIDFGAIIGLYAWMNDTSWLKLSNDSPTQIIAGDIDSSGKDDVIAVFGGGIFINYDLEGWIQLHNSIPDSMAVGDLDSNGEDDLVVDFGDVTGLYAWMNGMEWLNLHNGSPDLITTGDIDGNGADDVVATFGSSIGGTWQMLNLGGWSELSGNAADEIVTGDVDASGEDDLIANFGSTFGGIFVKRDQGAWSLLHIRNPDSIAVGNLDGSSATVIFSGQLDIVEVDTGGGQFSGTAIGTNFSGFISYPPTIGVITNGTTRRSFGCCIAADGLSVTNNEALDVDTATFLNSIAGSDLFSAGEIVDIIDIEGDTTTAFGGRIEVGLSYVFDQDAFSDDSHDNYPFSPDNVLLGLFYIFEEDAGSDEVYSAAGRMDDEPADQTDTDSDGIIDIVDPDDDNDGTLDDDDAFPQDPDEQTDTDNDGTGNNADADDDNDGTLDNDDAFPEDPDEQTDTDGDGTGNNADTDDDNDGTPDIDDGFPDDPDLTTITITISDALVEETDDSNVEMAFLATLPQATTREISVDYVTVDGTATVGSDYFGVTSTLTFDPGETSMNIVIPVLPDTDAEGYETFTLQLSSSIADLSASEVTGTIKDNNVTEIQQGLSEVLGGSKSCSSASSYSSEYTVVPDFVEVTYEEVTFGDFTDFTAQIRFEVTVDFDAPPGLHEVEAVFTIHGASDCELIINRTILITPALPPVVEFSADVTRVSVGNSIQFTNESENAITAWLWEFGDGLTSAKREPPAHTYAELGVYSVKLTAVGPAGSDTETKVDFITVGEGADIVIDFGAVIGLYAWMNDASWLKLANDSPAQMVTGDIDGNDEDDVIAVFAGGIFIKRNLSVWTQLHNSIPDAMAVGDLDNNGEDDVVIDFGAAIGLFAWMNDTSWLQLANDSPAQIVAGDIDGSGKDDVIAVFGSGIFINYDLEGWIQLHASTSSKESMTVGDLDNNGEDDLVVDFSIGLYAWMNGTNWVKLHNGSPDLIANGDIDGNGADDVIATFGNRAGTWQLLNLRIYRWRYLNAFAADEIVTGDIDASGQDDVIAGFGSTIGGLFVKRNQGDWEQLHNSSPEALATGQLDK